MQPRTHPRLSEVKSRRPLSVSLPVAALPPCDKHRLYLLQAGAPVADPGPGDSNWGASLELAQQGGRMITASTEAHGITENDSVALRIADGEFELTPDLARNIQGLFGPDARILGSSGLGIAIEDGIVMLGLGEDMESPLATFKLKIVRQMERGRSPYFMSMVEHDAEVQDPVFLEFREFIEADSPVELIHGLAEANRALLLTETQ